jgi:hypothetical protein
MRFGRIDYQYKPKRCRPQVCTNLILLTIRRVIDILVVYLYGASKTSLRTRSRPLVLRTLLRKINNLIVVGLFL